MCIRDRPSHRDGLSDHSKVYEWIFTFASRLLNETCDTLCRIALINGVKTTTAIEMQTQRIRPSSGGVMAMLIMLALISDVWGQVIPQSGITIRQAVDTAIRNYPAVTVSQEQIDAASAGIQLARTAYLPRVDSLAQVNRA